MTKDGENGSVEVDGIKRHIADVRAVRSDGEDSTNDSDSVVVLPEAIPMCSEDENDRNNTDDCGAASQRVRRRPRYLDDYVVGDCCCCWQAA